MDPETLCPTPTRPPSGPGAVLLLEDDPALRRGYSRRLRAGGHRVDEATTLAEARGSLARDAYDCVVLDRMVPGGDALVLVDELRADPGRPPVLVLSGLGEVDDRLAGLHAGADDYLAKPAHLDELALRVDNLVAWRRQGRVVAVHLGGVVVDRDRHVVSAAGEEVHLTPHQYGVLDYLVAHHDRLVTTEELLDHCWDGERSLFTNPLHSQITRLRRVFRGHLRFEAVRGTGYVVRAEGEVCAVGET